MNPYIQARAFRFWAEGSWFVMVLSVGAAAAMVGEGLHRQCQPREHQVDAPDGTDGQPPHKGLHHDQVAGYGVQDAGGQQPAGARGALPAHLREGDELGDALQDGEKRNAVG